MHLDARPKRAPGILAQEAPDSETLLLLDPDGGEYYTLDSVGRRIWELLDGASRVDQIVALICAEYDAPAATIERDVTELLSELADARLIDGA